MAEGKLKAAAENPWYVLATIHGEKAGETLDVSPARKNVQSWNSWATQYMPNQEIGKLSKRSGSPPEGAGEWHASRVEVTNRFRERFKGASGEIILPDPRQDADLKEYVFTKATAFAGMIFPARRCLSEPNSTGMQPSVAPNS